jgi:diguanylate cyclase (GGDEF)-like protein
VDEAQPRDDATLSRANIPLPRHTARIGQDVAGDIVMTIDAHGTQARSGRRLRGVADRRHPPKPPVLSRRREWFGQQPGVTFVTAVIAVVALGAIDWATGPNLAFSVFYLMPVAGVASVSPGRRCLFVAGCAALAWMVADLAAGAEYSTAMIPVWNTATRFAVFAVVGSLVSRLQRAVAHEQVLARTDHLTGAANSRWFSATADERMRSGAEAATLVYLDLDDFKAINDSHGHGGGDAVLKRVAEELQAAVRHDDLVARVGGDEFVLLLLRESGSEAVGDVQAVVERVRSALHSLDPPISFSAGAVTFTPPPATIADAVDVADALMYDVKRRGKGAVALEIVRGGG